MHPVLFHIGAIVIPAYGAMAALGVLLALMLALRTARVVGIDPNQVWNLSIVALFTALVGSRILLVLVNWEMVRTHPLWVLSLAMIHHPALAAVGAVFALAAAILYALKHRLPPAATADALAPPLALGLALEQVGALLAGSSYGRETSVPWAVLYANPLAARWSGAPLHVPVHPVQAYAALAFLTLSICLLLWLPNRKQQGDVAGMGLLGMGVAVYFTEFWRDPEGRGVLFNGFLNAPQAAAIAFVIIGALALLQRNRRENSSAFDGVSDSEPAFPQPGLSQSDHANLQRTALQRNESREPNHG